MTKEFDARNERKSRSVCAAMAEAADTGKRVLTEREREILDMWPKFEGGEPVMIGDEATNNKNQRFTVKRIEFWHGKWMLNDSVTEGHYLNGKSGERVKRTAPKVLDADGVEIKVGDTVWHEDGSELHVIGFGDAQDGETMLVVEYAAGPTKWGEVRCLSVTHTRPDSWERLEEDAGEDPFRYCKTVGKRLDTFDNAEVFKSADIVRRAKKLAKVEVD